MAIPFLAILKAAEVLLPLTRKRSKSEEADAKKVLADNNGPISSSIGMALMASGVAVGTLEDAVYGFIMGLVGLICYFYRKT